ncbi:histidine phosphatase family protein [Mycetocola reblochoni]|uniref:Histidine phosphatase family protein n=2 Tax=Mycetocola reblochoni TaxID=331618 RepID=A0A3L6ZJS3_9MICO|nr:histidine phosphatase family protein [Mycetocola reblochoni]RLP68103.1 histidine phosphatase family protein [Mycetocola reblochoni]SJN40796.1 putative phosphoglycerate mutase [Mycetocola reblochoni REB411]
MNHYIYLARHGEQQDAEHGLSDGPLSARGRRQAALLADRLSGVPMDVAHFSPLQPASETAEVFATRLPALRLEPSALLFDTIPSGPSDGMPPAYEPFFGSVTEAEIEAGSAQMADAVAEYLAPRRGECHELLITHNSVVSWLVREALGAPAWRWMSLTQAHCALTVIAQRPGRPWTLLSYNDLGHIPVEDRTGLAGALAL